MTIDALDAEKRIAELEAEVAEKDARIAELEIEEHYTDTHGYTEINFAAFAMLGRRFARGSEACTGSASTVSIPRPSSSSSTCPRLHFVGAFAVACLRSNSCMLFRAMSFMVGGDESTRASYGSR